MTSQSELVEILLIEDNPADVELTKQGLKQGRIGNQLHVAMNGDDAMTFLHREGEFKNAPRPDLILLDLNLPGMDGREVLKAIKADEELRLIPVIVLTSSSAPDDVIETYRMYANAFMTKPVEFSKFVELVKSISDYWFTLVKLPPESG